MIYILVFFFLLALTVHFDILDCKQSRVNWERIAVGVLILLSALRNQVGDDTFGYEFQYRYYPTLFELFEKGIDWEALSQPLWIFLNCFFKTITDNFVLFQVVIAVFFNLMLYYFFKTVCKKVFACFLLFFLTRWYIYNFEILRESLSVVIYLAAIIDYIKNKKLSRYFLICLPAIFIHWFSFVMVLLTPLFIKTKRNITLPLMTVLGVGALFLGGSTIVEVLNFAALYVEQEDFLQYLSESNTRELNLYIIFIQGFLLRMLLPFTIISPGREEYENEKTVVFKRILVAYIFIGGVSTHVVIAYRLLNYLYPILIVLAIDALTQGFTLSKGHLIQNNKHVMATLSLVFCLLSLIAVDIRSFMEPPELEFRSNIKYDCRYLPYTTVFEEKDEIRSQYYNSTSHVFDEKVYGE